MVFCDMILFNGPNPLVTSLIRQTCYFFSALGEESDKRCLLAHQNVVIVMEQKIHGFTFNPTKPGDGDTNFTFNMF